jgi:hypothetical protein
VPDLYCPGYSSAETLSKEANLMRTAVRYKVDASKVTIQVTGDLSAKRTATRHKARLASSRARIRRPKPGMVTLKPALDRPPKC